MECTSVVIQSKGATCVINWVCSQKIVHGSWNGPSLEREGDGRDQYLKHVGHSTGPTNEKRVGIVSRRPDLSCCGPFSLRIGVHVIVHVGVDLNTCVRCMNGWIFHQLGRSVAHAHIIRKLILC